MSTGPTTNGTALAECREADRALRGNPLTTHALCGAGPHRTRCRAVEPPHVEVSERPSGNSGQVTSTGRRAG